MLEILGFIFWLVLFYVIVLKAGFFKDDVLNTRNRFVLFSIKMIASCAYAWIVWEYYDGGDTMGYFVQGRFFHNVFHESGAAAFWQLMLQPNIGRYPDTELDYIYKNSIYWTNNGSCFMARFNAFLFFVSGGSYYTHSIIYGFLSFTGLYAMYKFCKALAPAKSSLFAIALFLVPSIVFWGAGIHKEAFAHLCLGFGLYGSYLFAKTKNYKYVLLVVAALILMYYIRNYVVMLMLPAALGYYLSIKGNWNIISTYIAVYSVGILATWMVNSLVSETGLIYRIVGMQNEFISGGGRSVINEKPMVPTLYGLIQFAPRAAVNAFFRPFFQDCYKALTWFSFVELYLMYTVMILYSLKSKIEKDLNLKKIGIFFIIFAVTYFIFLGYLVNTFGAMVRYKASALPFFLCGFIFLIDSNKISGIFKNYK